jgi:hypothetical protein
LFSSECKRATIDEQIKAHVDIGGIGILELRIFYPKSALKRFLDLDEGKKNFIKNQLKSCCCVILVTFLTSKMNFMKIVHDLGLLKFKIFLSHFCSKWGSSAYRLKILIKIDPQELKNWLLTYLYILLSLPAELMYGTFHRNLERFSSLFIFF